MASEAPYCVRPISTSQRAEWEKLWYGYQQFYSLNFDSGTTDETWRRIHDSNSAIEALGAYQDERLIGIAHFVYMESTWSRHPKCYLQDLYVSPEARKCGVGGTLIQAVKKAAKAKGAYQLTWLTHEDNATARGLYDKHAVHEGYIEYSAQL
jgi:GNAT superfamily N-acetyltransferase